MLTRRSVVVRVVGLILAATVIVTSANLAHCRLLASNIPMPGHGGAEESENENSELEVEVHCCSAASYSPTFAFYARPEPRSGIP